MGSSCIHRIFETLKCFVHSLLNYSTQINCSVLLGYFKACGLAPMIIFTIAYISYNTAQVKASLWLSDWSNDNAKNVSDNMWRLKVYACFGVMQGKKCILFLNAFSMFSLYISYLFLYLVIS